MSGPSSTSVHSIVDATVVHRRLRPRDNAFSYRVAYLCLISRTTSESAAGRWAAVDRPGLASFRRADHGGRTARISGLAERILASTAWTAVCDGEAVLMTLPRMLGYVFNPVSFWFCRDRAGALAPCCARSTTPSARATATWSTINDRHADRAPRAWLDRPQGFHVSPFLPVEGGYRFRSPAGRRGGPMSTSTITTPRADAGDLGGGSSGGPDRRQPCCGASWQPDHDPGGHRPNSLAGFATLTQAGEISP